MSSPQGLWCLLAHTSTAQHQESASGARNIRILDQAHQRCAFRGGLQNSRHDGKTKYYNLNLFHAGSIRMWSELGASRALPMQSDPCPLALSTVAVQTPRTSRPRSLSIVFESRWSGRLRFVLYVSGSPVATRSFQRWSCQVTQLCRVQLCRLCFAEPQHLRTRSTITLAPI